MVAKVTVQLVDDIDGSVASETIQFAFEGVQYEIDLSEQHLDQLRNALQPWVTASRKLGKAVTNPTRKSAAPAGDTTLIRAWAKANGYLISDRGRVSSEIREAYASAH